MNDPTTGFNIESSHAQRADLPVPSVAVWNDRVEALALELAMDLEHSVDAEPARARRAADAFVAELMEALVAEYETDIAEDTEEEEEETEVAFLQQLRPTQATHRGRCA